jgi:hypothetical protein
MTGGFDRAGSVLPSRPNDGKQTGGKMKLISNFELHRHNEQELSALFGHVAKNLVRTKRHSPERRNALASLENIGRARAQRLVMRPP